MHVYDISVTISSNLPTWPGDPPLSIERITKIEDGDISNVTWIEMSAHVGTHVDAPFHFLGHDANTVEKLPLDVLLGRAYVLHLDDDVDMVTKSVLQNISIPPRIRRLLIRTRNSKLWKTGSTGFDEDFVAISDDGARYIVDRGIKLIGVDYFSVAPYNDVAPTHKTFLSAEVVILEGLDLSQVPQGRYSLYCLPLKIGGADGAPARAILIGG